MGIFRETPIEWGDKEYTLVPNMKLLRKIEMGSRVKEIEPFSLSRLVSDINRRVVDRDRVRARPGNDHRSRTTGPVSVILDP
jgi:hypothetical protein